MKLAVCLSGQPRTLDLAVSNILHYFSGKYEVDFFCHAWDYNTYKRKKENRNLNENPVYWTGNQPVDHNWLMEKINLYRPKKFLIESVNVFQYRFPWDSLFYSLMKANDLKKQYEYENNFKYDFVVRTRYDIVYDTRNIFVPCHNADKFNYLDIYVNNSNRMAFEYNKLNVSDEFFYGSSFAMDIMSDLFRHLKEKSLTRSPKDYECFGPGTSMSDYAESKNLRLFVDQQIVGKSTVLRPEVGHLNVLTDFEKIRDYSISFYI